MNYVKIETKIIYDIYPYSGIIHYTNVCVLCVISCCVIALILDYLFVCICALDM